MLTNHDVSQFSLRCLLFSTIYSHSSARHTNDIYLLFSTSDSQDPVPVHQHDAGGLLLIGARARISGNSSADKHGHSEDKHDIALTDQYLER